MSAVSMQTRIVDGMTTRYLKAGSDGPPIVFLTGGLLAGNGFCNNFYGWEPALQWLAPHFRCFAPECLGQGLTPLPARAEDQSLASIMQHIESFILSLDCGPVHLVGHDEAGLVAMRIAFKRLGFVRSCTVVSGASVAPSSDEVHNPLLDGAPIPAFGAESQHWIAERLSVSEHHLREGRLMAEACAIGAAPAFRELVEGPDAVKLRAKLVGELGKAKSANHAQLRDAGLPAPALIAWGLQDPVASVSYAQALFGMVAARQPHTQMAIVNRAGALPHHERPVEFAAALAGFVNGIEAADRKAA